MSAFLAALRLSRRDALRFKGRSALIMVMIALPVLVITGVLTAAATTHVSPKEQLISRLGSADASVNAIGGRVRQNKRGDITNYGKRPAVRLTAAEIGALVGGRVIPYHVFTVHVWVDGGYDVANTLETDLRDPMAKGLRPLVEGRYAAAPGEVTVSPELRDRGLRVGGTIAVTRENRQLRVVGVAEHPTRPGLMELTGLPGTLTPDTQRGTEWLADTAAPVWWSDVPRLNKSGLAVVSRAVIEEMTFSANLPGDTRTRTLAGIAIGVVLVVTETVLLAGPAFAVGLRRRRRELAMLATQGASPGHLRTIVLADGLVLGGAAALTGALLGIGGGALVERIAARQLNWGSGPIEVPWLPVLAVAALGLLSGLIAALVPASQAAGQSPVRVLAGRTGEVRDRAGLPVAGLALVVLGVGVTVFLAERDQLKVAAGFVLVVLGLVAVTPWLVRATGRLARRLPLPARLSVRDAARHRSRTASATAAVMAATMAAVATGIAAYTVYEDEASRRALQAPLGTMTITTYGADDREWARVRAGAQRLLPGVNLVSGLEARDERGVSLPLGPVLSEDCLDGCAGGLSFLDEFPVGDARLLAFFQGRTDPRAAEALAAGKAVVFHPGLLRDGRLAVLARPTGGDAEPKWFSIPAVLSTAADEGQSGAVIPASAVTGAGLKVAERKLYSAVPGDAERLEHSLGALHERTRVDVEEGHAGVIRAVLGALLGAALILVLGGTFAATGLAAADMRADLDTLSAVGGPPRTRRLVVAAQAGYIAALGAVVGLVPGVVMGIALIPSMVRTEAAGGILFVERVPDIAVPWLYLAGLVIGLPLLAALLAGTFTRTRPSPARRLD
ncbi:FtsX-like permease family protein [Nonomuraea sp. NN258]|uniref:FtsX-like permease family protein n=1 Tax=Nonomuraea antri TaxID=2730852 RepID=UPI001569FEB6|nr:FtsX-like permease family protein [Nonomuraea antri]NRQ33485.1 FtsX-like permease family protein [Nonomuraea antri]